MVVMLASNFFFNLLLNNYCFLIHFKRSYVTTYVITNRFIYQLFFR